MDWDDRIESVYLGEIEDRCAYAMRAIDRVDYLYQEKVMAMANGVLPGNIVDLLPDIFNELAAFLQHAAAVSRILWPGRARNADHQARADLRGERLREAIGVPDPHPLQSRELRDHLEHFDERLDDWVATSPKRGRADHIVGPERLRLGDEGDVFRHYDPRRKVYVFRGERYDIRELVAGVRDVDVRARRRTGHMIRS